VAQLVLSAEFERMIVVYRGEVVVCSFRVDSGQYFLGVGILVATQDESSSDRRSPFFDSPLKGPELTRLESIGYLRIQTDK
jgi:hypothetical protein